MQRQATHRQRSEERDTRDGDEHPPHRRDALREGPPGLVPHGLRESGDQRYGGVGDICVGAEPGWQRTANLGGEPTEEFVLHDRAASGDTPNLQGAEQERYQHHVSGSPKAGVLTCANERTKTKKASAGALRFTGSGASTGKYAPAYTIPTPTPAMNWYPTDAPRGVFSEIVLRSATPTTMRAQAGLPDSGHLVVQENPQGLARSIWDILCTEDGPSMSKL